MTRERRHDHVVSERSATVANALADIVAEIDGGKPAHMLSDRIVDIGELAKRDSLTP